MHRNHLIAAKWYLRPEEASRVAMGHRELMNLPPTEPIDLEFEESDNDPTNDQEAEPK